LATGAAALLVAPEAAAAAEGPAPLVPAAVVALDAVVAFFFLRASRFAKKALISDEGAAIERERERELQQ